MSNRTLTEWISSQNDGGRAFAQEQLIVAVTEKIWECMDEQEMSKAELAKALNRSKAYVTQVLNGTRNMTLRTLADFAHALGCAADVNIAPRSAFDWTSVNSVSAFKRRIYAGDARVVLGDGYRAPERNMSDNTSDMFPEPPCVAPTSTQVLAA